MTPVNQKHQKASATTAPINSLWHRLVEQKLNRRSLFKGAAMVTASAAAAVALPIQLRSAMAATTPEAGVPKTGAAKRVNTAGQPIDPDLFFKPITPSGEDKLIVPEGFSTQVVTAWGDEIAAGLNIGFNHDFQAFMPIDFIEKGADVNRSFAFWSKPDMSSTDGILVINHEYVNPMFTSPDYDGESDKTPEMIKVEQQAVGLSIVHIQKADDKWSIVKDDKFNRRLDALTPITMTGPARSIDGGPNVIGTLANCSGGVTPWGTVVSCEENFQDYPTAVADGGYGWDAKVYGKRHYGWVVEVDPFDPASTPRKHTAMGRFRHENVAIRVGTDGTVVAYMGDDRADSCVYKFVADQKLSDDRAANLKILEKGKLYVADFSSGKWILLDYKSNELLRTAKDSKNAPIFASQAGVLADTRMAGVAVKGTPVDRPEDIEIHPKTGDIYISLTNNTGHGNFHGQIVKLSETENDPAAEAFAWEIFAVGGSQSGFSSPDNLTFDAAGNLWMVTDVSSSRLGASIYKFMGNNAMFFFRTEGPFAGIAYQFASGPVECEMTGQCWTPDGNTLFLSVQHPGEESEAIDKLSSTWPNGDLPRPASVAITGTWGK